MKKLGYREMLRDRCPKVVDYALKWQKAKERWIDHTYNRFVNIFIDKEERKKATRLVLCIKYTHVGQGKNKKVKEEQLFEFDKSIDWDNLTDEENKYWLRVSSWVKWFQKQYAYMENAYTLSKQAGKTDFDIKVELINSYLSTLLPSKDMDEEIKQAKYKYVDNLVNFLVRCFENRI